MLFAILGECKNKENDLSVDMMDCTYTCQTGKGLVIIYGEGGYRMGESRIQSFLRSPPPLKRG